jgi:hypothetical protein
MIGILIAHRIDPQDDFNEGTEHPLCRRCRMKKVLAAILFLVLAITASPGTANAVDDDGTFVLISPRSSTAYVTSPGRFHNGCTAEEDYDSPDFDNGTCSAAGGSDGDFSLDIAGSADSAIWIDIDPESIDGQSSGGTWRLVAGAISSWNANCSNGGYQTFYLQTKNLSNQWENNAKITMGHGDTWQFDEDEVAIGETSSRDNVIVGYIAPDDDDCWPEHIHGQVWNYQAYARIFDLDGPSNATDTTLGPACIRTGGSDTACNTQLLSSDGFGYVGGTNGATTEFNNPHFSEF